MQKMAESKEQRDVGEVASDVPATGTPTEEKNKKRGVISRIWNGIFRLPGDDFEKRLQHISKEEAAVLARMKKRSLGWRRMARNLIIFSVLLEVIAVGYAIMTTRSLELNWKMRALRVLPMFLLPGLSFLTYSSLVSFNRMCERKDQKTLERLRAERQAKIDELKEKTNYYTTQQLIQRYDPDPAAKAAAASVLASKLGADSGLTVYMEEKQLLSNNNPTGVGGGKSNDVEFVQSTGLRKRNQQLLARSTSIDSALLGNNSDATKMLLNYSAGSEEADQISKHNQQLVVDHHSQIGSTANDGGWIARIAALLVGEDPTQSYALICGNCHMHNGLARKEDFPYITYYCPHCNALNRPKQQREEEHALSPIAPNLMSSSSTIVDDANLHKDFTASASEKVPTTSSTPVADVRGKSEGNVSESVIS